VSRLEQALRALHIAFEEFALPYMVIGGMANARWGLPRATLDVDVTVWAEDDDLARAIKVLCIRFRPLVEDPLAFVRETRVLPLDVAGVRADVIFGLLPYERDAIARAVPSSVGGCLVLFCTAEDLILHKILSDRERDREDVRGILAAQRGKLDAAYLDPRIRELADLLGRPSIWEEYLQVR
jgi:hypothetical protein